MNPIARLPQWLRGALNLTTDEVPKRLRIDQVVAAIELGQQGWAYAEYFPVQVQLSIAAGLVVVPAPLALDPTVIRRLIAIEVNTTAPAPAAVLFSMRLLTPALGLVLDTLFTRLTETALLGAQQLATTAEITQGLSIVIPPSSSLRITATGLVGAEVIDVDMLWARFPTGFPLPL